MIAHFPMIAHHTHSRRISTALARIVDCIRFATNHCTIPAASPPCLRESPIAFALRPIITPFPPRLHRACENRRRHLRLDRSLHTFPPRLHRARENRRRHFRLNQSFQFHTFTGSVSSNNRAHAGKSCTIPAASPPCLRELSIAFVPRSIISPFPQHLHRACEIRRLHSRIDHSLHTFSPHLHRACENRRRHFRLNQSFQFHTFTGNVSSNNRAHAGKSCTIPGSARSASTRAPARIAGSIRSAIARSSSSAGSPPSAGMAADR